MDLPIAALDRLLRRAGAERVSEEAARALGEVLEEHSKTVGSKAADLARHAKRKTVTAEDVRLAAKG